MEDTTPSSGLNGFRIDIHRNVFWKIDFSSSENIFAGVFLNNKIEAKLSLKYEAFSTDKCLRISHLKTKQETKSIFYTPGQDRFGFPLRNVVLRS